MKAFKRLVALLLVVLTVVGVSIVPASAASTTAFDILSSSKYAKTYTLSSTGTTIPYTSKYLTTRGTVTYGASSKSYISNSSDELYVLDVGCTNGTYWAYVSYPTSSGRVKAYIRLSAISSNNSSHAKTVSTGRFYCSLRPNTSTSSKYYVAKGDTVYLLSTSGSKYQIMYPAGSVYRMAWCKKTDYVKYCASSLSLSFTSGAATLSGKGATAKLEATINPTTVSGTVAWSSSNTNIATVSSSGVVTAKANGTVTITATLSGTSLKASKTFTVKNCTPSTQTQNMSYALYKASGGRLTCGFDGYVNTKGRHEGIDFARGYGSAVYSLTDGVITRITEGYNGSSGLSTIAIYSASTGKTVIYLHADPLNSLYVGQSISKGQQIATEAWRGCSSYSGTHTHVEVRDGRRTSAAKSVNDYTLENTNPTSFWNNLGYQVK